MSRQCLGDVLGESGLDAVMSENEVKLLQLVVCRQASRDIHVLAQYDGAKPAWWLAVWEL